MDITLRFLRKDDPLYDWSGSIKTYTKLSVKWEHEKIEAKNSNKMPSRRYFDGQFIASVSRELGVAESLLHKWRKAKFASGTDLERENLELKKRLREVEMERDILKKAAQI